MNHPVLLITSERQSLHRRVASIHSTINARDVPRSFVLCSDRVAAESGRDRLTPTRSLACSLDLPVSLQFHSLLRLPNHHFCPSSGVAGDQELCQFDVRRAPKFETQIPDGQRGTGKDCGGPEGGGKLRLEICGALANRRRLLRRRRARARAVIQSRRFARFASFARNFHPFYCCCHCCLPNSLSRHQSILSFHAPTDLQSPYSASRMKGYFVK